MRFSLILEVAPSFNTTYYGFDNNVLLRVIRVQQNSLWEVASDYSYTVIGGINILFEKIAKVTHV